MAHKVSFAMMHDPEFDPTDSLASLLGVYLSHIPASMMEEPIRAFYYKHMRKIQAKQRERAQRSMPWLPDYE
jgi:hypothetical protein